MLSRSLNPLAGGLAPLQMAGPNLAGLSQGKLGGLSKKDKASQKMLKDLLSMSAESAQKARWNLQLRKRIKAVEEAQKEGGPKLEEAIKALGIDYKVAKSQGIEINPKLEKAIQAILGKDAVNGGANGANGAGGGGSNGLGGLMNGLAGNYGGGGGGGGGGFGGGDGNGLTNLNGGGGFGGGMGRTHAPKPLGEGDHNTLQSALNNPSGKFDNLISGWRQTAEGNCASVAAIKAAMKEYGNKVFDNVQRSEDGYSVKLKDGSTVNLSNQEFAFARGQAKFAGNDPQALAYAELCYSVMAKKHATNHNVSLDRATVDMNNGFDPRTSARILGLGGKMTQFNGTNGVIWDNRHAMARVDGMTDLWGRAANRGAPYNYSFLPEMPSQRYTINGSNPSSAAPPEQQPASQTSPGNDQQASLGNEAQAAIADVGSTEGASEGSLGGDSSPESESMLADTAGPGSGEALAEAGESSFESESLASNDVGESPETDLSGGDTSGGGEETQVAQAEAPEPPPEQPQEAVA